MLNLGFRPITDLSIEDYRRYLDIMVELILTMKDHDVIIVY